MSGFAFYFLINFFKAASFAVDIMSLTAPFQISLRKLKKDETIILMEL